MESLILHLPQLLWHAVGATSGCGGFALPFVSGYSVFLAARHFGSRLGRMNPVGVILKAHPLFRCFARPPKDLLVPPTRIRAKGKIYGLLACW